MSEVLNKFLWLTFKLGKGTFSYFYVTFPRLFAVLLEFGFDPMKKNLTTPFLLTDIRIRVEREEIFSKIKVRDSRQFFFDFNKWKKIKRRKFAIR
jgi:hypothetical protein